jgi:drug/metabolite transporter (DMT)-like permease
MDCLKGVKHIPFNLQRSDNLLEESFTFAFRVAPCGKQWKTIIILSILNFALSRIKYLGVKYISSGLGAILNAVFPLVVIITFLEGKLAILGLIISFGGVCVIFYDHLSDFLQPDFRFGIFCH